LLFDEADSLFGKRTDVKDSNDRFANAQTNYLLQRIENFDGIAILTSNSRARFDSGFSRRLDAIIDFPLPGPEERRALWVAHLGGKHGLSTAELNELCGNRGSGGRTYSKCSVSPRLPPRTHTARPLVYNDIVRGLAGEYRKLGRHIPAGLAR
jgi:SpoVK/Ycf46/Vps4 family AAA+-type ATPase